MQKIHDALQKGAKMIIRNIVLTFVALILMAVVVEAGEKKITFGWQANTENFLVGYKLYYSPTTGGWTEKLKTASPIVTIPKGTHEVEITEASSGYYVLTAYSEFFESLPSVELGTISPISPVGVKIKIVVIVNP